MASSSGSVEVAIRRPSMVRQRRRRSTTWPSSALPRIARKALPGSRRELMRTCRTATMDCELAGEDPEGFGRIDTARARISYGRVPGEEASARIRRTLPVLAKVDGGVRRLDPYGEIGFQISQPLLELRFLLLQLT